jgi:hypothetical protein
MPTELFGGTGGVDWLQLKVCAAQCCEMQCDMFITSKLRRPLQKYRSTGCGAGLEVCSSQTSAEV